MSTDPTDRGQVTIVLGFPTGLNTELRDFFNQDKAGILDDAEPFDRYGISLASGDFNGDGRDDLAIGIQGEDVVGASDNILETGAVAVLYGSNIGSGPVAIETAGARFPRCSGERVVLLAAAMLRQPILTHHTSIEVP